MLKKTFLLSCASVGIAMVIVLFTLPTPQIAVIQEPATDGLLLIRNATVFNGETYLENTDIEIRDGLISQLSPNLESKAIVQIDASGKTIIPGLIDAHTHSYGNALETALNFGVTTQVDMFTHTNILKDQRSIRNRVNQSKQADLFSSGMLATVDGGHGTQFGIPIDTLSSPSEANGWVEKRIAERSDFIKLVYMPYSDHFKSLDRKTAAAIIQAAHEKNLIAVAHISSQRAALELLEMGIDGFVHIFADEKVSQEFLQKAKETEIFIVPTLSIIASANHQKLGEKLALDKALSEYLAIGQIAQLQSEIGSQKIPGFELSTAIHNTNLMHQSGIPILAGSDSPNPGTTYGASIHQELDLLTLAGLSPSEAINAASKDVVKEFKLKALKPALMGQLTVGAIADLIILESSPSNNIKATRKISHLFKNGIQVNRVRPIHVKASKIASPLLSNFAEGLNSLSKFSWSKTDDSMANGASTASVKISHNALSVKAKINKGFMFPWAGAIAFSDRKVDISDYSLVSFKIRGTAGDYQAMTFSGTNVGTPPSQSFSVNGKWQTIQLPLSDFKGLNSGQFSGLAIIAGPSLGEFEYYLDDVKLL